MARRNLSLSTTLGIAAVVGIVGYVAGLATVSQPRPAPSAVAGEPSGRPQLPNRSAPAATLQPTDRPASAWRRTLFPLDEELEVEGVWGLDDRVLALASYLDSRYVPLLRQDSWPMAPAPPAISWYWGGTVVDGRLWFLGAVPGLGREENSLRLVGTNGDENAEWKALPPSDLDPEAPIRFLEKVKDTWVTAFIGEGGNIEIGAPQYLRWSSDGVHWKPARIPSLRGVDPFDIAFNSAAATRDFIVVHANVERSGVSGSVVLVSEDGVDWREVSRPEGLEWSAGLACGDTTCVMTPVDLEETPLSFPMPIAWVSADGSTWTPSETILADAASGNGLFYVTGAREGFVGIDHRTNVVWRSSPDGRRWRPCESFQPDLRVPIVDLAISGNTVVALERQPDVDRQGAWVGSLAELGCED